jgi:hypothetical protein
VERPKQVSCGEQASARTVTARTCDGRSPRGSRSAPYSHFFVACDPIAAKLVTCDFGVDIPVTLSASDFKPRKMVPITTVLTDLPENRKFWNDRTHFAKICPVGTNERDGSSDARHPRVVKDDVPADRAQGGEKSEVRQRVFLSYR